MKRAFTRAELLAVVLMVTILAVLAIPVLAQANEEARRAACGANVRRLGLGMHMLRKDYDGQWTREPPGERVTYPETIADIAALGYVNSLDYYVCPSLATPFTREPRLIEVPDAMPPGDAPDVALGTSFSQITDTCYFADEGRIPKEAVSGRVVLADGIEMLTHHGREPANHASDDGRAIGVNVGYADMASEWIDVSLPEHEWVMDQHGVDGPSGIGYAAGWDAYPHVTGGTWRRRGYVQNLRLLAPGLTGPTGPGEDDVPNDRSAADQPPADVDDIYYEDCDVATYGAEDPGVCAWSFVAKARGARYVTEDDKDPRDCSLAGGSLRGWRGEDGIYEDYPQFSGSEGWGWPDELPADAVWVPEEQE